MRRRDPLSAGDQAGVLHEGGRAVHHLQIRDVRLLCEEGGGGLQHQSNWPEGTRQMVRSRSVVRLVLLSEGTRQMVRGRSVVSLARLTGASVLAVKAMTGQWRARPYRDGMLLGRRGGVRGRSFAVVPCVL